MIRKILTYYAERLEEYLSRTHRRPEGLATVGMIGNSTEERPNKMVVSLLNVERETAVGGSDTSSTSCPSTGKCGRSSVSAATSLPDALSTS